MVIAQQLWQQCCLSALGLLVFGFILSAPAQAHNEEDDQGIDVKEFARKADFIFKGRVTAVAYRNSEPVPLLDASGQPVLDDAGQPLFQDGSNLPHAFVTFFIEKIYKGRATSDHVTLRVLGGVFPERVVETDESGNPVLVDEFFNVSQFPLFDVGDREVLFVEGNTQDACPLVRCALGRFRLLNRDPRTLAANQVYNNQGQEIVFIPAYEARLGRLFGALFGEVQLGPPHPLAEVDINTIGSTTIERIEVEEGGEPDVVDGDAPPDVATQKGVQFEEAQFDRYVEFMVLLTHSPIRLRRLPPVASADISQAFFADSLEVAAALPEPQPPRPRPQLRSWLNSLPRAEREAILEAERQEAEAFERNGGNPVLP